MSKLARALILATTLAAINLTGMTAVAHAQPPTSRPPGGWPPKPRSGNRGATARPPPSTRPPRTPPSGGCRPESASPSLARHPSSRPPQRRPSRAHSPTGSWLPSVALLPGLALAGGLAVLAARRAGRSARIQHAA
jgi:hypothetical protein